MKYFYKLLWNQVHNASKIFSLTLRDWARRVWRGGWKKYAVGSTQWIVFSLQWSKVPKYKSQIQNLEHGTCNSNLPFSLRMQFGAITNNPSVSFKHVVLLNFIVLVIPTTPLLPLLTTGGGYVGFPLSPLLFLGEGPGERSTKNNNAQ